LTHLLFVDDVLLFGASSIREFKYFNKVMDLYGLETNMEINFQNSSISFNVLHERKERLIIQTLPFQV
jgi:hypothetical protein